ncbi:MAG: hypothetical protein HY308_17040 [Gammaproteobacteria bacterium]|nr:hypothetical protein [Gammaproteobacteria bacterium]
MSCTSVVSVALVSVSSVPHRMIQTDTSSASPIEIIDHVIGFFKTLINLDLLSARHDVGEPPMSCAELAAARAV